MFIIENGAEAKKRYNSNCNRWRSKFNSIKKIQGNIFLEKYSKGIAKYLGENANTIVREIGVADYAKGYGEKIIRK